MKIPKKSELVLQEVVERAIRIVRGKKVMVDVDLARLYGVETKVLNRAVKRNRARFPSDFMFQLSPSEAVALRCQFVTSTSRRGGRRYLPYAFTQEGIAMLSSVLNSERAILVNIQIMRTFVRLREYLSAHADLRRKLEEMEKTHNRKFQILFEVIRQMTLPPRRPAKRIGFHAEVRSDEDARVALVRLSDRKDRCISSAEMGRRVRRVK
ncbi:MAG: ORF6N domain-containing protein [Planctomycetota bacterium]